MTQLATAAGAGNGIGTVVLGTGGVYIFRVGGTFGGTTVTLQELGVDGATWETVPDTTLTVAGKIVILLAKGSAVRVNIAGGTGQAIEADLRFAGGATL